MSTHLFVHNPYNNSTNAITRLSNKKKSKFLVFLSDNINLQRLISRFCIFPYGLSGLFVVQISCG